MKFLGPFGEVETRKCTTATRTAIFAEVALCAFERTATPEKRQDAIMISVSRERALADEIVSVLTSSGPRVCATSDATIQYSVRGSSLKLRSIVFVRSSLRHLLRDRDRAVKIEYLQRDLERCAAFSTHYRYPRR